MMKTTQERGFVKRELDAIAERVQRIRASWSQEERTERAEAGQERRTDLYRLLLGIPTTSTTF